MKTFDLCLSKSLIDQLSTNPLNVPNPTLLRGFPRKPINVAQKRLNSIPAGPSYNMRGLGKNYY